MRSTAVIAVAVVLFFFCNQLMTAQNDTQNDSRGQTNADVETILTDLDHQWLAHARTRQTQFLQGLFTDDFVEILDGGQILTKAQLIGAIEASNTQMDALDADEIKVNKVSPNVAILTDRTTIKGRFNGQDVTARYRVFRIFLKQHDKWCAAGAVLTRIVPGAK
jgi:ketosteroid isomerase-like protein